MTSENLGYHSVTKPTGSVQPFANVAKMLTRPGIVASVRRTFVINAYITLRACPIP